MDYSPVANGDGAESFKDSSLHLSMLIIHAQLSCIRLTDFTMSNLCFNRIHTNVNSCCCGNGLPDRDGSKIWS